MTLFRPALVLTSLLAGIYSVVAFLGHLEGDAYVAAIVAILAAGGVLLINEMEAEHNRRIAQTRRDVWTRRGREGFGQ